MRRALSWVAVLVVTGLAGCLHGPLMWSPDGRWLAYAVAGRPPTQALPPGWIFGADVAPEVPEGPEAARPIYRIWATRVATGESVLLEESNSPLTSPGWKPDGTALAFGRLVAGPDGPARFEVVVQDGPSSQRVIRTETVREPDPAAAGLPGLAVAWSPDGRHLAVPNVQPPGLAILRADNGRLLKVVEDAFFPAWSPDGSALAFYRTGEPEGLYCLDAGFGALRRLADVAPASQPPAWSRDGRSVLFVHRRGGAPARPTDQADLVRIPVDGGPVEPVATLTRQPIGPEQVFTGAWFSLDRDGQELFFTAAVEGQDSSITWYRPAMRVTEANLAPIDRALPVGALALSPTGEHLAVRVGPPGLLSPPALCEPRTMKTTPLVPDDTARVEWVATLAHACRALLQAAYPPPIVAGQPTDRPTILPAPGEATVEPEAAGRLRRLGELGRSLCRRPEGAPADEVLQTLLDEARLVFAYLAGEYDDARAALGAVETRTTDPGRRLRLLALRAQIELGRGDPARARDVIALLRQATPRPHLRVEMSPAGTLLTALPVPGASWPDFLAEQAEALELGRRDGAKAEAEVEFPNPAPPEPPPRLPGMAPAGELPGLPAPPAPPQLLPIPQDVPPMPLPAPRPARRPPPGR